MTVTSIRDFTSKDDSLFSKNEFFAQVRTDKVCPGFAEEMSTGMSEKETAEPHDIEEFRDIYQAPRLNTCDIKSHTFLCGSGDIGNMSIVDPQDGDNLFE